MPTYDYFISYSSKDKDIAFRIVNAIESEGLKCWIAPRNIPVGSNYASAIMKGIDNADKVIVLITKNSVQSNDVLNEVDNAHSIKKTIIPVRFTDVQLSRELNYYLSRTQWLTISSSNPEDIVKSLNLDIESSKAYNLDSKVKPLSVKGKRNSILIYSAVITAIVIILGIWVLFSNNFNKTDRVEISANDNLTDTKSDIDIDGSLVNQNPTNQTVDESKIPIDNSGIVTNSLKSTSDNNKEGISASNTTESQSDSQYFEELKINADSYYNSNLPQNHAKALELYKEISINYDINYADKVGYMYYYGIGTNRNSAEGINWCKKAADKGNHDAQIRVGRMLMNENRRDEAAKYYLMGENYVRLSALNQNDLGVIYFYVLKENRDVDKAIKYWQSAADAKNVSAMVNLGDIYSIGKDVEKNSSEAARYYKMAADNGHKEALSKYNSIQESLKK